MKIKINDHRRVFEIQKDFTKQFPYLKIEFFSKTHAIHEASSKKLIEPNSKTLGECRTRHNDGAIDITPQMKVSDLEQAFMNVYGLSIQVFRKSGKVWLETTVTDNWSLEEQNQQGEDLSKSVA